MSDPGETSEGDRLRAIVARWEERFDKWQNWRLFEAGVKEEERFDSGYRQAVEDCIAALRKGADDPYSYYVGAADFLRDRFLSGSSPEEAEEPTASETAGLREYLAAERQMQRTQEKRAADAVERAARAAFDEDNRGGHIKGRWTWDTIPEEGRENYRTMIRAALRAAEEDTNG